MECCTLSCVGVLVLVILVYKLLDKVLRWPRISSLSDRYILVTGCDTGFGNEIARRLDALGCHVFAGCLTEKGQNDLRTSCSSRLTTLTMDVTSSDSIRKAFEIVKNTLPEGQGLWGVLNNAGILGCCGPEEWLKLDDYRKVFAVNLLGLIDVTTTFLPLVKRARGRIVNMASVYGRFSPGSFTPYSTSKYGVESFSDGLRRSMRSFGCRVILIEPGFHKTHITSDDNMRGFFTEGWNNATPESKEDYGVEYYEKVLQTVIAKTDKIMSYRVSDVVDAYEHAILGRYPRARYVVGNDAHFLWLPLQALPEWLGDWLFVALDRDPPIPAAVKKMQ